jgi:2-hydroxy-6-oxonona-2,4-dienedioate hydrolase/4,5:9,10-diseco-3-hydroxy-5,9,17-trioxoandrosta-1(10),2-diene-4-oate hydrolase
MNTKPPESQFAQAGGVKIHYQEGGSGDPLICIHGAGPGATGWSNFKGNFDYLTRHFRTILIDMPQYGKSDKPVIPGGRLAFLAQVLNDFMSEMKIEKAVFIGNSMGGQAALKLAIDFPERVKRLAVIGSSPLKAGSIFQPMPLEAIRNIRNYYLGDGPSIPKMRQLLESLVSNASMVTDDLVRERHEASLDPEIIELNKKPQGEAEDLYFELANVKAPALLVWGQDDRAGALDVGLLMLRRIANARMILFSKCGHWANVEHRDEFNRVVVDFLKA